MTDCIIPFDRVATREHGRSPRIQMKPEVMSWILERNGKINWLMGFHDSSETWKVRVKFHNSADALLFKLTWGGA